MDNSIKLSKIKDTINKIKEKMKTNVGLSPLQLSSYRKDLDALYKEYRILKSKDDFLYFAYEYFSEDKNPGNLNNVIPKGVKITDAPEFHRELTDMLWDVSWNNPTDKIGWASPRGTAKTTYLSNLYPLYNIVMELRKYIVIISETGTMSEKFIDWISDQLKHNKKLRDDYGVHLNVGKQDNKKDNNEQFITTNDVMVQATSIGKQLRGAKHGAYRPDLVIMDDLESDKNTNTKELREKNALWYSKTISPIGDPDTTAYLYLGTLVHGQGLLPKILNMTDYKSRIYSMILDYPDALDEWDIIYDLLTDITNENRLDEAYEYYNANQEEMDRGVKLLWGSRFTYFDLMRIKADIGSRAFASEYLNRPSEDETKPFRRDDFQFYDKRDLFDKHGRAVKMDIYGFWDMAVGKNSRADYNAIVILAVERRTGHIYVLEAWAKKVQLHEAKKVAKEKIKAYKCKVFGVESVNAQFEIYRQLKAELQKERWYTTRMKAVNNTVKKESRIESLEPLVENGTILFLPRQSMLLDMLEIFPDGDYDDLPDALEGAVNLIRSGRKTGRAVQKPRGM